MSESTDETAAITDRNDLPPRHRRAVVVVRVCAAVLLVAFLVGWTTIGDRPMLPLLLGLLPQLLIIAGSAVFGHTIFQRVGDSRHCADCDYEVPPTGPIPPRCPECGNHWTRRTGLGMVQGRKAPLPWRRMGLGLALVLLGLSSIGLRLPGWNGLLRIVPDALLIETVVSPKSGFVTNEWAEINRRATTLTREQKIELAAGLLDRRLESHYLDNNAALWLETQIAAGALPAELVGRCYDEMVDLRLAGRETVREGQPLDVRLEATNAHHGGIGRLDAVVAFGGFHVDDSPTPHGRENLVYPNLLDDPRYEIELKGRARQPGPVRVRAEAWIVIAPAGSPALQLSNLTWNPDGSPNLPAGAAWTKKVVLEKTVTVTP